MSDYNVKWTGTTTTAVAKEIFQATGLRYPIGYNASYRISGTALAQSSTLASKEWSWSLLIKNDAGTTSLVGAAIITELQADAGASSWALALTADDTNDALAVTVTGAAGVTISWSVYADVDVIGYVATDAAATKLTTPQLIEMVQIHHPKVGHTIAAQMLSTAQAKFVRNTMLNAKTSRISMASQTLVGTSEASPLTLTDSGSVYSWSFYKDTTVETITLKSNSNVMLYTDFFTSDSTGAMVDAYTLEFRDDKMVRFYDTEHDELEDFDGDVETMVIHFIKQPALLTVTNTSIPEILAEYHESLAHSVIAELYMSRVDMPVLDRLQLSKHFQNLYKEQETNAKFAYNRQMNAFSISTLQGDDFGDD